jgi:predicted nucleic acid-binding protein
VVAKAVLIDRMEGRLQISVPALLHYEVSNILLFGRSRPTDKEAAAKALKQLFELPLTIVPLSSDFADIAILLARTYALSFYDACYLALAIQLDCTLITADQRLVRKVRTDRHVRLLSQNG